MSSLLDGPHETIRVLHVDDEASLADLAATFVEREDDRFTVETATSASEGMDRLADDRFDCIVSDYDMPGRNGIEFLQAIREDYPDLPFILYTGKGSEEVASTAISEGVTDYLQKETGTSQYAVLVNRIANAVDQYRSKREVEASQQRHSLFFDQSPLGVVEWTENFEFRRVNETAEEILGYPESELLGNSWEMVVPESDSEVVGDVVADLLEAEGGYHSVNGNVRKDGERIDCEWHNRVITDESGDVVAIFSQFIDVTERIERDRELERYEAYLQESTDIITVLDESGTIEYQSPSVTRTLGYEPGTLVGEDGFEFIHPDDVDDVVVTFTTLVSESNATVTVECRFRTADGEWRWLEIRGTDQQDHDAIEAIVTNSRDITNRKARERELRRKERRYQAIFNDPNILVGLIDTDGTVLDINKTAIEYIDATIDEVTNEPFWETPWFDHSAELREEVREWIDRAATGEYVEFEADLVRPTGEAYTIEGVFRPVTDDDGDVVSLLISDRDITDRKERERALQRERDRLDEFASVVSHDLRNPLRVADGRLELAREECDSDHHEPIATALDRMECIIDHVLRLAREGRDIGETEAVDLWRTVEDAWSVVEADTDGAELRYEGGGTPSTIRADADRLQQLLENLLRNAIEHGGPGVTLRVERIESGFAIEDDGPGIPAEKRDRVFDVGYSSSADGVGFGLNIVERVVDAHDWKVAVAEGADGGARFEITDVDPGE